MLLTDELRRRLGGVGCPPMQSCNETFGDAAAPCHAKPPPRPIGYGSLRDRCRAVACVTAAAGRVEVARVMKATEEPTNAQNADHPRR
jgi:hypothetical protein